MEWLSGMQKSLAAVQSAAVEAASQAAEHAKIMAAQASEQAKVYAEQATEQAKVLRSQAEMHIQQLKQNVTSVSTSQSTSSESELDYYGVTEEVLDQVRGLSYATFSDSLVKTPIACLLTVDGDYRLNQWQEKHVMLILARVEQLQHLRFALCPKRMDEPLFWSIYFTELSKVLPPQAFGLPALSPHTKTINVEEVSQANPDVRVIHEMPQKCLIESPEDPEDENLEEDDPELDAYLEAALALEGEEGDCLDGSELLGSDEVDDLDDYINSLKEEDED